MQITAGTRLGPYEIVAPIGSGGMGEVFKARDTRLDRSVAIKLLPAEFAANVQLRLRFEREAKTISQLNHPNICTLHDIGHDNGTDYLVLELIDGESLADRLSRGALPVHEAMKVGAQIADALDRAHRAGIVHRDLKPGNVMLTKSGVKLLDFGLAKSQPMALASHASSRSAAIDATEHKPLTEEGTIVGTFQYMAPEQLEGDEADARTDIFAFGALLYEMATGRRAFEGKTKTSLIAAIVSSDPPPISSLQPLTPPALEHVVRKCLAKDRDDRWQSAHDIAEELRWISEAGSQAGVAPTIVMRRKSRERLAWAVALIAALALAAAAAMRRAPVESPITTSITAPLHAPFEFIDQATLSPDGKAMVFVGRGSAGRSLWLRQMDRSEPQLLPSTDRAEAPFWSPDGKSIGFFADGKVKRIAIAGGPPQVIGDAPIPATGGSWNDRGVIVMGNGGVGPLYRVDAGGGKAQPFTKLGPREEAHRWPQFLPDGEHVLFLADASKTEDHHISIVSLTDGSAHAVMQAVTNAQFVAPDTLLFVRARTLLAQSFDTKRNVVIGEPRVVAEQIVENGDNHHYEFSASSNGRLLYRAARADAQLQWVDRGGRPLESVGEPRHIGSFRLAPDQQRVLVALLDTDGRGEDVWLIDRARSLTTRITFDPASEIAPVWSRDSSRIFFCSMRTGLGNLYTTEAANPTAVKQLTNSADQVIPWSTTRDGREIVAESYRPNDIDIGVYSFDSGQVRPYIATPFAEAQPSLSPDDQWIAYQSNESGRFEVFVERFPTHAARRQVSTTGGRLPRWRGDSRELYYVAPGGMVMSLDVTSETSVSKPLFRLNGDGYEPAADGQRFLVDEPLDDQRKVPITFVSNWR